MSHRACPALYDAAEFAEGIRNNLKRSRPAMKSFAMPLSG